MGDCVRLAALVLQIGYRAATEGDLDTTVWFGPRQN